MKDLFNITKLCAWIVKMTYSKFVIHFSVYRTFCASFLAWGINNIFWLLRKQRGSYTWPGYGNLFLVNINLKSRVLFFLSNFEHTYVKWEFQNFSPMTSRNLSFNCVKTIWTKRRHFDESIDDVDTLPKCNLDYIGRQPITVTVVHKSV